MISRLEIRGKIAELERKPVHGIKEFEEREMAIFELLGLLK